VGLASECPLVAEYPGLATGWLLKVGWIYSNFLRIAQIGNDSDVAAHGAVSAATSRGGRRAAYDSGKLHWGQNGGGCVIGRCIVWARITEFAVTAQISFCVILCQKLLERLETHVFNRHQN
jgi:hypothetical protein